MLIVLEWSEIYWKKSRKQHPTKRYLYDHLHAISKPSKDLRNTLHTDVQVYDDQLQIT